MLAGRFGKKFTKNKLLPDRQRAAPPKVEIPTESLPDGDCDGDGTKNKTTATTTTTAWPTTSSCRSRSTRASRTPTTTACSTSGSSTATATASLNRDETDDDDDLLSDTLETAIGTDPCVADTDGDSVEDGYEYQSAQDLNDDEYQEPERAPPVPGQDGRTRTRCFADAERRLRRRLADAASEEYDLWVYTYSVTQTDPRDLAQLSLLGRQAVHALAGDPVAARTPAAASRRSAAWATTSTSSSSTGRRERLPHRPPRRQRPLVEPRAVRNSYGLFDMNRYGGEHGQRELRGRLDPVRLRRAGVRAVGDLLLRPLPATATCPTTSATRTPTASRTTTRPTAA